MSKEFDQMTDEEFSKYAEGELSKSNEELNAPSEPEKVVEEEVPQTQGNPEEEVPEDTKANEPSTAEGANPQGKEGEEALDKPNEEVKENKKVENTSETDNNSINYEEAGKLVLGEFKANGKVMKVNTPEEAIKLMQMGANYHQKMAQFKPQQKILRSLEQNGLTEEKINIAIDLLSGDKSAIKALLKSHNIDAMDLEESSETEQAYVPKNYSISDSHNDLMSAVESCQHIQRLGEEVFNKWDSNSVKQFQDNPKYIISLNNQVEDGTYDKITSIMEKQRMLGNHQDKSDLELYCFIGENVIREQQNALGAVNTPPTVPTPVTQEKRKEQPKPAKDASQLAPTTKTVVKNDVDINKMSDDDFSKYAESLTNG